MQAVVSTTLARLSNLEAILCVQRRSVHALTFARHSQLSPKITCDVLHLLHGVVLGSAVPWDGVINEVDQLAQQHLRFVREMRRCRSRRHPSTLKKCGL